MNITNTDRLYFILNNDPDWESRVIRDTWDQFWIMTFDEHSVSGNTKISCVDQAIKMITGDPNTDTVS